MKFNEETLKIYAQPLSPTEKSMCENAIKMIRDALTDLGFKSESSIENQNEESAAYTLIMQKPDYRINIFVKGSYANNTNVRQNSDVDIAIVSERMFHTKYREGVTSEDYGFVPSKLTVKGFKDEVEKALKDKFNHSEVSRGNIAIRVNGNNYRKDSDCVPCVVYRNYENDLSYDQNNFIEGIYIVSDKGDVIINYPKQHLEQGVNKNKDTKYRYKKIVRIAKELNYQLEEKKNGSFSIKSYGVESLFYNIPNKCYLKYETLGDTFNEVINHLIENIDDIISFKEANGILNLCKKKEDVLKYQRFVLLLREYFSYEE